MATRHPHQGRPSKLHTALEFRWLLEAATLPGALPWLLTAPRGDGHTVLLLPGFMASEVSMIGLEVFLRNRGYDVHHWGFGRNIGFQPKHAKALEQKIRYLHHKTGRKITLIGWSLGGVFALYGTLQAKECVRSVITLGSPISRDLDGQRNIPGLLLAMYRLVAHPLGAVVHESRPEGKLLAQNHALGVPVSCLYGIGDGVVPPQEATITGDPSMHENIRVPASHIGMGFNPMVYWVVADRLAQAEDNWQPFVPSGLSGCAYRALTHAVLPV